MIWKILSAVIYVLVLTGVVNADAERHHQVKFCKELHGQAKYRLPDKTRCDCLTDEYAIEIEFAYKWYQAIGQSLHYALMTGKKPGIALILRRVSDKKYIERLNLVLSVNNLNIKVWIIKK